MATVHVRVGMATDRRAMTDRVLVGTASVTSARALVVFTEVDHSVTIAHVLVVMANDHARVGTVIDRRAMIALVLAGTASDRVVVVMATVHRATTAHARVAMATAHVMTAHARVAITTAHDQMATPIVEIGQCRQGQKAAVSAHAAKNRKSRQAQQGHHDWCPYYLVCKRYSVQTLSFRAIARNLKENALQYGEIPHYVRNDMAWQCKTTFGVVPLLGTNEH